MRNVVPLRSKSEVRLRSAILSKLILLLLALTLQRESSKELTQKIGPIPPRLRRIIGFNLVLPRKGKSVGAWKQLC